MINVTILPIINTKSLTELDKLMNERLTMLSVDLRAYLTKMFAKEIEHNDLVIYMSYNAKYTVQWQIMNDVPKHIQAEVAKCCDNLGYFQRKQPEQ